MTGTMKQGTKILLNRSKPPKTITTHIQILKSRMTIYNVAPSQYPIDLIAIQEHSQMKKSAYNEDVAGCHQETVFHFRTNRRQRKK